MGSYTVPYVIERTAQAERSYDVFSRLLNERIIFLGTEIEDGVANVVIAQLLHLQSANPEREISIYLNSPGRSFTGHPEEAPAFRRGRNPDSRAAGQG